MALTATITLAQTPISFNQVSQAYVTLSNSGASAVTVQELHGVIQPQNAVNYEINMASRISGLPKGFGQQFVAPASGSVQIPFSFVIDAPQVAQSNSALAVPAPIYNVGCYIMTSDGSLTAPTPAAVTITPLQLNSAEL